MVNKLNTVVKEFISKIDKAAGIQLTMILLTIVVFGFFLSVQKFLLGFEGFITKIVIVDVLLGVGILIEVGYFIWHTNKQGKQTSSEEKSKEEDTKESKEEAQEEQTNQ